MQSETKKFSILDIPKSIWYFLEEDKFKFVFFITVLAVVFLYDLVPAFVIGKIVDFFTSYKIGQPLSTFYFYIIFLIIDH